MDADQNRGPSHVSISTRPEIRLTAFESWINENASLGTVGSSSSVSTGSSTTAPSTTTFIPSPYIFTVDSLPSPRLVQPVIDAFYEYSAMLISVIPREEYLTIYRKLYWGSSEAVGKQTQKVRLVELCGLLACGCEHAVDVPAEFRQACKDTVKIFLDEITEISELRAMRIYTLCAMFSLLDKPTAAWSYVGSGLRIAKECYLHEAHPRAPVEESETGWAQYRKTWRSLKFLQSWLTCIIGRSQNNSKHQDSHLEALAFDIATPEQAQASTEIDTNRVQVELTQISILTAAAVESAYITSQLDLALLDDDIQRLDGWLSSLPPFMQLKAFQEQDPGTAARRGILLAHITYLNARVAVACRAAVDEGPARTGRKHVEHVEAGISAAVQTQRIVGILLEGKNIWRRCWLLTHAAFQAASLLLFHVSQLRLHGLAPSYQFINSALVLINALRTCGTTNPRAESSANALQSIFHGLGIDDGVGQVQMKAAADMLHTILRRPFQHIPFQQLPNAEIRVDGLPRPGVLVGDADDDDRGTIGRGQRDISIYMAEYLQNLGLEPGGYWDQPRRHGGVGTRVGDSDSESDSDDDVINRLLDRPDQIEDS